MAKSNLKTLNNNNITQFSLSSVYSINSYIYNTYNFLSFIIFFKFFFITNNFKFINFTFFFFNKNCNRGEFFLDSSYYSFMTKCFNFKKFNKFVFNFTVRIFFYSGRLTHIYDFYLSKRWNMKFLKLINKSNLTNFKYYTKNKQILSLFLK